MKQIEELNKKERTLHWFKENQNLTLSCIHCHENLQIDNLSLVCPNNHRFDMAKQGYYFLAKRSTNTKYDANLFQSRRNIIMHTSLYQPLHDYIHAYLKEHFPKGATILDAGSGEGSHLWQMTRPTENPDYRLLGVDLSKSAIQAATDYNGYMLAMIADLAELPIAQQQLDIVLSIFSPSNYAEFDRILKSGGELIKVIPNSGYLEEIRQALIDMEVGHIQPYSNDDVIDVFKAHYPDAKAKQIKVTQTLSHSELEDLIVMTPLTWQLTDEERLELLERLTGSMTLDVTILHGKK